MTVAAIRDTWIAAAILMLAWGAGAFGSPYPWAYRPLLAGATVIGVSGLALGKARVPLAVAIGLSLIAAVAAMTLVPLPPNVLRQVSPSSLELQMQYRVMAMEAPALPISIDADRTILGLTFLGAFSVLLVGTARFLTRDDVRKLARGVSVLGAGLAFVGIVQEAMFTGKIYGFWELKQGGSVFGPFVNNNHFAGWMLMAVPLAIGALSATISRGKSAGAPPSRSWVSWWGSPSASKAILLAFSIAIMTLALVLTLSRSGIMSLAIAVFVASAVMARRQTTIARRVVVAGYAASIGLMAALWVGFDRIAVQFAGMDPTSVNERPAIWADTLRIVSDFWPIGTGLNTYGVSTLYYQTSVPGFHLREAHNDYLQLASEGGLLLGVPIAFTIVAFAVAVRKRQLEDVGSVWWLRMGAVIGIFAIACQSFVEFSLQIPGNAALFSVLCGIALHDGRRISASAA